MLIVVDTNLIYRDFHLAGTNFKLLLESAVKTGDVVYFPQVVIDETKNKYLENLMTSKAKIDKEIASLNSITGTVSNTSVSTDFIKREAKEYNELIEGKIVDYSIKTIPYPTVSHQKLVQRALLRKRPFTESGKGYRDALIWENLKSLVPDQPRMDGPTVVFITANSKDFGDEKSLHADLIDDLNESKIAPGSIQIVESIERFNETHTKQQLKLLNKLKFKLKTGRVNKIDFDERVRSKVKEYLGNMHFDAQELGLRDEYEDITVTEVVKEDIDYKFNEVRVLSEKELLITVTAKVNAFVNFFIFKADYYSLPEDVSPHIFDHDWNNHYVAAEDEHEFELNLLLTVDREFTKITSEEIELIIE